jgi:hypothetical protein
MQSWRHGSSVDSAKVDSANSIERSSQNWSCGGARPEEERNWKLRGPESLPWELGPPQEPDWPRNPYRCLIAPWR